ncbi:MAG: class I SAM-dependent methyltransferase [Betaproteobacteria bacterium]|nr:class I SAM-dependent methyltransferase [Betaproteobacteria bacterium]
MLWLPAGALAQQQPDVPYVPTPWNVVEAMLEAGGVTANDYLIDLGSGDGRVVIEAARKRGARGMGIELDGNLVSVANREATRLGVSAKASFISGNLFTFDFSKATVLTMYLLPKINLELRPRILAQMRPGTRIVSHDFDMGQWKPDMQREIAVPNKSYGPPVSQIYLWYVPADFTGKWQWQLPAGAAAGAYEATFRQTFQELSADAVVHGGKVAVQSSKLRGDTIAFTLVREVAGQKQTHEFSGRIEGDRIAGRVKAGGDDKTYDWQATRLARGQMNTE